MLQLTKKVDYAILVATHIHGNGGDPVSANEIATAYNLSRPFIANIMKQLARESILKSERGVNGGYTLNRPAGEITLNDIVTTLDGPFRLADCTASLMGASEGAPSYETCAQEGICAALGPIRDVHRRIQSLLDEVTVEEMAGAAEKTAAHATIVKEKAG